MENIPVWNRIDTYFADLVISASNGVAMGASPSPVIASAKQFSHNFLHKEIIVSF